jgi:hypothetical protein
VCVWLLQVTYTVKNNETYVNPAGNPGQAEVMKITIDPTLVLKFGTIGNPGVPIYFNSLNITTQYKLNTMFYPTQRLATIPPLQQLFTAQDPSKQVVKHIMLMERLVRNPAVTNPNAPGYTCPQGLAVSECKTSDGPNGVPEQPTGSTSNAWGVPKNCLTESGMPRNMFADGLPLTCKEGEYALLLLLLLTQRIAVQLPTWSVEFTHCFLLHTDSADSSKLWSLACCGVNTCSPAVQQGCTAGHPPASRLPADAASKL